MLASHVRCLFVKEVISNLGYVTLSKLQTLKITRFFKEPQSQLWLFETLKRVASSSLFFLRSRETQQLLTAKSTILFEPPQKQAYD